MNEFQFEACQLLQEAGYKVLLTTDGAVNVLDPVYSSGKGGTLSHTGNNLVKLKTDVEVIKFLADRS